MFAPLNTSCVKSTTKNVVAYARKVLIAYDKEIRFYQKLGFTLGHDKSPMFVTCLTT